MSHAMLAERLREVQNRTDQSSIQFGEATKLVIDNYFHCVREAAESKGPERLGLARRIGELEQVLVNLAGLGFVREAFEFNDSRYLSLEREYGLDGNMPTEG